jgi:transcriptional regulator with XRE-family HTH domain
MSMLKAADAENTQRNLGRRIRDMRMKHGWSQEQFAGVCGLHRTYMGHVERGEKNVSLSTVLRVANALGVGLAELFGGPQGGLKQKRRRLDDGFAVNRFTPLEFKERNIGRLLEELAAQRTALRQAIRDLSRLLNNRRSVAEAGRGSHQPPNQWLSARSGRLLR